MRLDRLDIMNAPDDRPISRQRRVGAPAREETRRRLQQAAAEEFIEHGYAAATVNRIAKRAGVTVQTLYLAWGSKRALLRAYMTSSLTEGRGSAPEIGERFTGLSPWEITEGMARLIGKTAATSGAGWKLYRDAAATDPEIAEDWDQLQALRRFAFEKIVSRIPATALRAGVDHPTARDMAWAIASPETYELLVTRAGYSLAEFEQWMATTLAGALLATPARSPADTV
jgi:AcrR family transcriptional regulator